MANLKKFYKVNDLVEKKGMTVNEACKKVGFSSGWYYVLRKKIIAPKPIPMITATSSVTPSTGFIPLDAIPAKNKTTKTKKAAKTSSGNNEVALALIRLLEKVL